MLKTKNFFWQFCFFSCIFFTLHISHYTFAENIKRPNAAGSFYPADKAELQAVVVKFLAEAEGWTGDKVPLVLLAPHAGYIYSGPVAAYGFSLLRDKSFQTVVVLAASHYFGFSGAAVYPEGIFRTPMGDLEVDSALASSLVQSAAGLLLPETKYFDEEHSLEVQLPFLQATLKPGFKILPVILGEMSYEQCDELARRLSVALADSSVLLIASSDLSHYKAYEEARRLDAITLAYLRNLDAKGLWEAVAHTGWNVCGAKAVVTALLYARQKGAGRAEILKYANSGDTAGDKKRVVGYASAVVWRPKGVLPVLADRPGSEVQGRPKEVLVEGGEMLTKEERRKLLEIARATLEAHLNGKRPPVFDEKNPALMARQGAFVTLRAGGELRGCIGNLASTEPLFQLVSKMAIEAATRDWRFSPLALEELKNTIIEISVLSVPQLVDDWRKIRMGTDGVVLRRGASSGVFLPQVATETGWDLETFLSQLCFQKAGLPSECYKSPETKLYTFQAEVFSEKEY